ncbi:GMC family oxidoreductase [Mycolicibacterium celeriflavum]|uniref:Putative GMC-type oxidoreductase n=1 Tax=Mycolicibacterium celeriflavum TaxID=1249101 RepID=A0A1X0BP13_MYCCF|nr:GMC family oxidoreductase N-terminal domain-containing protein [Mycolicibacterium celeriflavum]MCV7238737.1 GMC family oxidoreductase N-terminal domain-containing protein [Mycolicibacterium celeriflavum]ORA44849.1 glucose-methanol-choline oxidoreductase [Mycolicibacterium celeriflavum]BBY46306.1 putative GMC-type oxidoreductase [Mycolicibacterium celeriflavum]
MEADYIVVGTGSAGSVVAGRLSADPSVQVIALEAGPYDKDKFIRIPAGFQKLFRSPMDWDYRTEPQKELDGREIYWPRGKMVGGSSSMNAMMWVRGFAADYDEWGEAAGDQWDYAHLEPYLRRIEAGPLSISAQRSPRSSTAKWLAAAEESGFRIEKPNQAAPEGFCETLVTQRRGARWSAADAYLKPALKRANLTLETDALATRVVFDGRRAVGVEVEQAGRRRVINARREVVLCGGAINSPQLLMLSGIGDGERLAEHGIETRVHAPNVGANLLDHFIAALGFDVPDDSLFGAEKPLQLLNYFLRRRGMLTSNVGEAYGFIRSRPDLALPDLELIYAPAPFFDEGVGYPYDTHAVVLGTILLKPHSSGTIELRSADPKDKPIIDPRYLTDPDGADRAAMMAGLRMCAKMSQTSALKGVIGRIARPLDATTLDDETLERALTTVSHTLYHPVGTCRMGRDDASVVDPNLRVRGVDGLRVADASVMPTIIRGHTHAPSVLIGEKAAELIRAG